jgi:hypothetical protein
LELEELKSKKLGKQELGNEKQIEMWGVVQTFGFEVLLFFLLPRFVSLFFLVAAWVVIIATFFLYEYIVYLMFEDEEIIIVPRQQTPLLY